MREILFRGQTRRYGEKVRMGDGQKLPSKWVYGGVFQGTGDFSVIYGAEKEDFTGADLEKFTVYSDTVGQYTGLKDKNGKRIFEGDIIYSIYSEMNYPVLFGKYSYTDDYGDEEWSCGWLNEDKNGYKSAIGNTEDWALIVGNIHDNPELLEGN